MPGYTFNPFTGTFDVTGPAGPAGPPGSSASLVPFNKNMPALTTTSDGQLATTSTVAVTPVQWLMVKVNGVAYHIGNGTKTGVPCYFSGDGGVTARASGAVVAGDELYWNGSVAGFELASGVDRIDFEYED